MLPFRSLRFPETKFIVLDCYTSADLPNVQTVVMEPQEASFLAGVVAAVQPNRSMWVSSAVPICR